MTHANAIILISVSDGLIGSQNVNAPEYTTTQKKDICGTMTYFEKVLFGINEPLAKASFPKTRRLNVNGQLGWENCLEERLKSWGYKKMAP